MKPYLLLTAVALLHGSLTWADEAFVTPPRDHMIDRYLAYGQLKMGRYEQAFAIWQRLATQGDADAAFQLGVMLEDGRGAPPDLELAISYYRQASEDGSRRAAHRLAALYAEGAPGLAANHTLSHHYQKMAETPLPFD